VFNRDQYEPPSGLTRSQISEFCGVIEKCLLNGPTVEISDAVKSQVAKRVAPSALPLYDDFDSVVSLAAHEIGEIGQRIGRYRYIERYKFFFETNDREMGLAFGEHLYELRSGQIYAVLERGVEIIRLCSTVADCRGRGDSKAANAYLKEFRSAFAYRLRERHRQAHAHERPSLASRILSLRPVKEDEKRMAAEVLATVLAQARFALRLLTQGGNEIVSPVPEDHAEFQSYYLQRVDEEASTMWRIFSKAIARAVGAALPEEPAST
jgi:hypothetical protein